MVVRILNNYWKGTVEEVDKELLKEGVSFCKQWLYAGTSYRRMVEPLDIAYYYREGGKDYINKGRSEHYKLLQKWQEEEQNNRQEEDKKIEPLNRNINVKSILTNDSCFWAHVEEAILSLKTCKDASSNVVEKQEAMKRLKEFEEYVDGLLKSYTVSPEIFLEGSTYMRWWNDYIKFKGSPHRSSLADFMTNYVMYENGEYGLAKDTLGIVGKGIEYKSTGKNLEAAVKDSSSLVEKTEHSMNQTDLQSEYIQKLKDDEGLPTKFTVGLDGSYMEEMKAKLLDAQEQVLNLYGLPGSGKTTMARKLCQNLEDEGKFKGRVIFVTLGSQIKVDEAMINKLQKKVSQYGEDSVLLVLDDVWPHSEDIIEKINLRSSDSRILVTSRAQMTTVTSRCQMKLLSDQDAEILLRRLIQPSAVDFDDPKRHKILLQIVESCKGLPLALKFIGRKIAKKNGTIEAFEEVQLEWSQGGSILDSHEDLLARLQNSVDESIKDYFMDLGLFPEDQKIPITSLIDMWTELHDLKEPASSSAYLIIQELISMNLADQVIVRRTIGWDDLDNYYNNHELVQHDLFRELAIHTSKQEPLEKRRRLIIDLYGNQNHPPEWWPKQQPSVASPSILSISTEQNITPDWCNIQAAATVVLVLNLRTSEHTLPEFIREMKSLKVLIVTNYGYSKTELRNLQLLGSLLSLKRIRLQKVSIPFFCDMKNVHKLSLYMCDVKKAFENSSFNFSKAMPKLEHLSIEYCRDLVNLPIGLCLILTMKNLTISSCHNFIRLPEEIGKLENLELLRVNCCSSFEELPHSITKLKNLSLLDISFCGSLRKLPDNIGELQNLTKLYMKGCSIWELPDSVINLNKLESVTCNEDVFSSWEVFRSHFSRLNIKTADDMDVNLDWLS